MGYEDEDDGDGNPLSSLFFIGLVIAGIFILYKTTGILIIPIPRK